jgi:hypothetical protein
MEKAIGLDSLALALNAYSDMQKTGIYMEGRGE